MSTTKRISLTIDAEILQDLDYLCSRLSVTRSSLISEFLRPTVGDVRRIVDFALPSSSENPDSPRARNPEQLREFLESLSQSRLESLDKDIDEYCLVMECSDGKH